LEELQAFISQEFSLQKEVDGVMRLLNNN